MKKENIYVVIDSEEKRLRALQILTNAGERIYRQSALFYNIGFNDKLFFQARIDEWMLFEGTLGKTEITLDQLEQLLKQVHITVDELKAQAESLGFELVKKERKPKVGDFGLFKDKGIENGYVGFLDHISDEKVYMNGDHAFDEFSFLTDEEKQQIQNNW